MRCFIAVDIPEDLREKIYKVLKEERERFPELKWVAMESLHITLKFLGSINPNKLEDIKNTLNEVAKRHAPFKLKPDSLGTFPEKGNIRVLWLSLVDGKNIENLAKDVEDSLTLLGFPKEKRPFTPHLTLARARRNEKRKIFLEDFQVKKISFPYFRVDHFTFYKSELRPEGPLYTKIFEFRLKG